MKPFLPILILCITLTGCGITPQGDIFRNSIEDAAQRAADQSAQNALDYLCKYARVGSINRLFQNSQDRMAYLMLCSVLPPLVSPNAPPVQTDPEA